MARIALSLVIPVYNEQDRLPGCLDAVRAHLDEAGEAYEVIVVDDGSRDDTAAIARRWASDWPQLRLLRHEENRGKGAAVRTGLQHAAGEHVAYLDVDLSTPLKELDGLRRCLRRGADIAVASRHLPGSRIVVRQPWHRRLLGVLFRTLVRLWLAPGVTDSQCGCKALRLPVARDLAARQRADGFAFDVELLYLARRLGYAIAETPVRWENSPDSRVRLLADGGRMLWDLWAIPLWHGDRRPARMAAAGGLVLLLVLGAVLRLACLGADPSPSLEYYYITDEGWWVHNARNAALFGRWVLDDFNQGFLYSPVHSLLLYAVFQALGVAVVPARAVSAVAGLLTGLFLYLAARAAGERRGTALVAAGLLITGHLFIAVNRLAYPESTMLCCAVLGWWLWLKGRPVLAGAAFGLSCFAKLAGVPGAALPAFLLGWRLLTGLSPGGEFRRVPPGERLRLIGRDVLRPGVLYAAGLAAVAALVGALIWLPNLSLLRTTYAMTSFFNSPGSIWNTVGNIAQFPVTGFAVQSGLLLALTWVYLLGRLGPVKSSSRPDPDPGHRLALAWLLLNALAVAPLRFHPVHRYLVFLPALAWLAARGAAELPRLRLRAAVGGILSRAADLRLGIPLLLCWPLCRGAAEALAPLLRCTGLPAFTAGSAAAYFFALVWCLLLCCLLLPLGGMLLRRRSGPAYGSASGAALGERTAGTTATTGAKETAFASRAVRTAVAVVLLALWLGTCLVPAAGDVLRPSWDLATMADELAPRLGPGARVMGLAADTALLGTPAFLFTPRIGAINQDPYERFGPTHALVMSAIDGLPVGPQRWFEEGAELCRPLDDAEVVDRRWAVDHAAAPGDKRFEFILYRLEGE